MEKKSFQKLQRQQPTNLDLYYVITVIIKGGVNLVNKTKMESIK